MRAMGRWPWIAASVAAALVLVACGGDDNAGGGGTGGSGGSAGANKDASKDGTSGTGGTGGTAKPDATPDSPSEAEASAGDSEAGSEAGDGGEQIARGEYLVDHIAACGDCHTPRDQNGPIAGKYLAGNANFAALPGPDGGMITLASRNLTPDMTTGLGGWTAAQIKNAFQNGIDKDGNPLFPIMPYFVLHNMTDADADAIVAYLQSIPAVANAIPARTIPVQAAADPVPAGAIPNPTLVVGDENYESAMRGKYLAGNVGICMECHTSHTSMMAQQLDLTKLFAGGEAFPRDAFGLPPIFPPVIFSENITPDSTGIQGWAPGAVVGVLHNGIDKDGLPICPPMPVGPMGAFGGITDGDALDIATYITNLPPIHNVVAPICHEVLAADGGSEGGDASAPTDAGDGG